MPKMLQVRNVPDRLHRRLKQRAARRSMTLTEYVLRVLEREDQIASFDDWLAEHRKQPPTHLAGSVADALHEARDER